MPHRFFRPFRKPLGTLMAALGAAALSLGAGDCGPAPLPENYLDEIFRGNPATRCGLWVLTITDIYIEKMGCEGLSISPFNDGGEKVEYRGHQWVPTTVPVFEEGQTFAGVNIAKRYSLISLLAPLTDDGPMFWDQRNQRRRDLFEEPLFFASHSKINRDPPAALIAADLAIGAAREEFRAQWRRYLLPNPWDAAKEPLVRRIQHDGPIQKALLPIGRLLRERCADHIGSGSGLIARISRIPSCQKALGIDPFLKALLGEHRTGEAVSPPAAARAGQVSPPYKTPSHRTPPTTSRPDKSIDAGGAR
jgi:hypothetical protein